MTFACVNQNDGDFWGVAISLADHFGGGAELFGGSGNGGGGAEATEFELKHGGGFVSREGHGVQFAKAVASAMMVVVFGVLVAKDALFTQVEVAREDGTNSEFGGKADDGEGGGLDPDLALALALSAPPKGKAFRPAKVFGVVVGYEVDLTVIGWSGGRVGMRMGVGVQRDDFPGFLAPTTQQSPALQRASASVPDQNHSPWAENF